MVPQRATGVSMGSQQNNGVGANMGGINSFQRNAGEPQSTGQQMSVAEQNRSK